MRAIRFAAVALAASLALGACDTDATRPLLLTAGGGGGLLLDVTPSEGSVTPQYSWSGGNARFLVVTRLSDGASVWRIEAVDQSQGFSDPVRHGVVPAGATQTVEHQLLDEDRYRVRVVTVLGREGTFTFNP